MKLAFALAVFATICVCSPAHAQDPLGDGGIAAQAGGYTDPFAFDNYFGFGSDPALGNVAAECDTIDLITAYASVVCVFSASFANPLLNPFCYASAAGLMFSPLCQTVLGGARGSGGPYRIYPGEL